VLAFVVETPSIGMVVSSRHSHLGYQTILYTARIINKLAYSNFYSLVFSLKAIVFLE
ncbi:hypothetical protein CSKR_200821, partial [Clonorchis sinensis]